MTESLFSVVPGGQLTLPGLMAALSRNEVTSFRALRAHQEPAWHMFLVQLGALALHRADKLSCPESEQEWLDALRGLTKLYPDDAPWCLTNMDVQGPAFMQAPTPTGEGLWSSDRQRDYAPDSLDVLITSRNHDLKQAVAFNAPPEDWVYALISAQTNEGAVGRGNLSISRMNGGFSSRTLVSLAPMTGSSKATDPMPGAWFRRNIEVLLGTREIVLEGSAIEFPPNGGICLTWLPMWDGEKQLEVTELDIWFIEISRRYRLGVAGSQIFAVREGSSKTRINAKEFKGSLEDPFMPINITENKAFHLHSENFPSAFSYNRVVDLLFSGNWELPVLARLAPTDAQDETYLMVMAALARGQCKTDGFHKRCLPISGRIVRAFGPRQKELHEIASSMVAEIGNFKFALKASLAVLAEDGKTTKASLDEMKRIDSRAARFIRDFERMADEIFFPELWLRFEAEPDAANEARAVFVRKLHTKATEAFKMALMTVPGLSSMRHRAQARATASFRRIVASKHPELLSQRFPQDTGKTPPQIEGDQS
ncbi:CRISPR-associated protein Cse1 [Thalassospira xianhensis]|uniref:CRISPR-associated protein Cse1 n=1 Tax=Thalassospira xianhensis TaxID=478503 RepID=UPI001ABF0716|nr:CRISPR-associated protein Cse1 [Thalassospira xianhensis]